MTKEDKIHSTTYHFYQLNPNGHHSIHSEDEISSEDNRSSDGGSDIVLNEMDDETDVDETDGVKFTAGSFKKWKGHFEQQKCRQ